MNHNSQARFTVRLQAANDTRFLGELPSVWSGGIRQLKKWLGEHNFEFRPCQAACLGGNYYDPKTGSTYILELR